MRTWSTSTSASGSAPAWWSCAKRWRPDPICPGRAPGQAPSHVALVVRAEDALELALHQAIAGTGPGLEPAAVENRDMAPPAPHQPLAFERVQGDGHARAAHAKHHREILVGERNPVVRHAVARHEKPAGETLLDRVAGVAGGGLGRLRHESVRVAQEMAA